MTPIGVFKANLMLAWICILLGFATGALLGLKFHHPNWLGGYTSHKRRLYRLGHISLFALGVINFLFALTARYCAVGVAIEIASIALVVGAITMPLACLVFAHRERLHFVFYIPVTALLCGAVLTLMQLARL